MSIYGVTFDGVSSAGTRTDDAVGMVWERSTDTVAGQDDFASVAPFNVRECVTKYNSNTGERDVLGYKGDAGYDALRADSSNDIMIEFPLFWYQRPSKYAWRISDAQLSGFKYSPMHYHNGQLYRHVRISKYALNSSYISQSGTTPLGNTNMNTFRTNIRAKGQYMMDYPTWCSIVMLSVVKYANMNVQDTVGQGASSGNSTITSGGADDVLGLDGAAGTTSATRLSVITHGIENIYSNLSKYIDGIFGYDGYLYYKDITLVTSDPTNSSELTSDYTKINTAHVASANQSAINDIAFDNAYDFGVFPTSTGSPNASDDSCWANSGFNCVMAGSNAWDGSADGLFCFGVHTSVGGTWSGYGAMSVELADPVPLKQLYVASDNKVYAMMTL